MHKVSTETLYHLQCGTCTQWWTIGDSIPEGPLYCPKCGAREEVTRDLA